MDRALPRVGLLFVLVFSQACGSGSGDTVNFTPPATPSIDASNVSTVAGASFNGAKRSVTVAEFAGGFVAIAASGLTLLNQPPPASIDCTGSGSVSITGQLTTLGTLTVGDALNFNFLNCINDSLIVNGAYDVTVTAFSGNTAGAFTLGGDILFTDLTIADGTITNAINGDLSINVNATNPLNVTTIFTGTSLDIPLSSVSTVFSGFDTTAVTDLATGVFAFDATGAINSSAFDDVTYTTPMTLTGVVGEFPSAGELRITASDNSSVLLIALDNTNVRLELDTDGDGAVDETIDTTWAALAN